MKATKGTLLAASLLVAGLVGATTSAHADVLNIPSSAAVMTGDYLNSGCDVAGGGYGIKASDAPGICDFEIPLEVPVGHTIKQIEILNGSLPMAPGPFINAYLSTMDITTYLPGTQFQKAWNMMPGAMQATRLMQQTKLGAYPDAFVTQASTTYQLVLHLEAGAFVSGVRVTYQ